MTKQEAARLMAALGSGWPNTKLGPDTIEVWYGAALERTSFDVGLAVITRMVETEEYFPTVAKFHEHRRAIERRNTEGDEPRQILAGPMTPTHARFARVARLIAAETPGCGDLAKPRMIAKEHRVHSPGESPAHCGFCQERFALSDDELAVRLQQAGIA